MPIDQIAVLVDRFGLEQESAGHKEVSRIALPGSENQPPILILDSQFDPALNHIERAGRVIMSDFVGSHNHPYGDRLPWCDARRGLDADLHDRPLRPLVTNLRNVDVALQPVHRQLDVLVRAVQVQQRRHEVIRRQEAVTAVFVIIRRCGCSRWSLLRRDRVESTSGM